MKLVDAIRGLCLVASEESLARRTKRERGLCKLRRVAISRGRLRMVIMRG